MYECIYMKWPSRMLMYQVEYLRTASDATNTLIMKKPATGSENEMGKKMIRKKNKKERRQGEV